MRFLPSAPFAAALALVHLNTVQAFMTGPPAAFVGAGIPSAHGPCFNKVTSTALGAAAVDLAPVRSALAELVNKERCGPILIRLAWHDAGTYTKSDNSGGPRGTMRFEDGGEAKFGANNGLDVARRLIQAVKDDVAPDLSHADFWALASVVAIKEMGGPDVPFRMGRKDCSSVDESVEEGRHPDGDKGADHLREVFYRMGLTDQDIVILSGAHTAGRCHVERSGFDGPWTEDPQKFDNSYYVDLVEKEYERETTSAGNPQLRAKDGNTMMLISDMALMEDDKFRPYVEKYAKDQDAFFADFAESYQKLLELGVKDLQEV